METRQACTLLAQGNHAAGSTGVVVGVPVPVTPEVEKTLRGGGTRF